MGIAGSIFDQNLFEEYLDTEWEASVCQRRREMCQFVAV